MKKANPAVENGEPTVKRSPNRQERRRKVSAAHAASGKTRAKRNERDMKIKAHRNFKEV